MKILVTLFTVAAAFTSVSALAHSGHEHHALQSSSHFVADSMMAFGAVVVALLIVRAMIRRNES